MLAQSHRRCCEDANFKFSFGDRLFQSILFTKPIVLVMVGLGNGLVTSQQFKQLKTAPKVLTYLSCRMSIEGIVCRNPFFDLPI